MTRVRKRMINDPGKEKAIITLMTQWTNLKKIRDVKIDLSII